MKTETLANMFPSLPEDEFQLLKESIDKVGLQHPILMRDGEVLDGRHRLRACEELGIVPIKEDVSHLCDKEVVHIVIARNISRRHLTAGQRAALAAALQAMGDELPNATVAKQAGVSATYVKDAKKIQKEDPETFQKLTKGEVTMQEAKKESFAKAAKDVVSAESEVEQAEACLPMIESNPSLDALLDPLLDGKVLTTMADRALFVTLSKEDREAAVAPVSKGLPLKHVIKCLHMEITEKSTVNEIRQKMEVEGKLSATFTIDGTKVTMKRTA